MPNSTAPNTNCALNVIGADNVIFGYQKCGPYKH